MQPRWCASFLFTLNAVVWFALATNAEGAVIDDFTQGPALLQPTNYSPGLVLLQTGLDTNATIGGTRRLTAQSYTEATLQIETGAGEFSFETVADFSYFTLRYGTEAPLGIDLKADGSEAFLLTFSDVSMPGLWRGRYVFWVNGIEYDLLRELAAIHGSGTIRIPFSRFSTAPSFVANQISLEWTRVEAPYRLALDSIVTVNADTPPKLIVALQSGRDLQLRWSTNATGFVVQTTPKIGVIPWQTVSNTVSVVGSNFSMSVSASEAIGYFRILRK